MLLPSADSVLTTCPADSFVLTLSPDLTSEFPSGSLAYSRLLHRARSVKPGFEPATSVTVTLLLLKLLSGIFFKFTYAQLTAGNLCHLLFDAQLLQTRDGNCVTSLMRC